LWKTGPFSDDDGGEMASAIAREVLFVMRTFFYRPV
jgi:hypothetical protein